MTEKHYFLDIKTISDDHLETFIRCPQQFLYQHIIKEKTSEAKWVEVIQYVMNQVVRNFYRLPKKEQTPYAVMSIIQQYLKLVRTDYFSSKSEYYTVIAKVTDHLLKFLTADNMEHSPFMLYEKINTYIEELQTKLSITFEVVEWSNQSFRIKKFLLSEDNSIIQLFNSLVTVFSKKVFGKMPEEIIVYTVLDGKKHVYKPCEKDVEEGLAYLQLLKGMVKEPTKYLNPNSLFECAHCPFSRLCEEDRNREIYFLH